MSNDNIKESELETSNFDLCRQTRTHQHQESAPSAETQPSIPGITGQQSEYSEESRGFSPGLRMQVTLISFFIFNSKEAYKIFEKHLAMNPMRTADEQNIKTTDANFLAKIIETVTGSKEQGDKHLFCSFFIEGDFDLLSELCLPFISRLSRTLLIASGTLDDWKKLVYDGCRLKQKTSIRNVYNKIYEELHRLKLMDTKQVLLGDGTFRLL